MNWGSLIDSSGERERTSPLETPRAEIVDTLKRWRRADVVIVGGGAHGAAFAHLAAFNGLRTVLFESRDYAFGTSGRSSKMAHGGLRYLAMYDFRQVFEGIKAREDLLAVAPHLVHPQRFLIPVPRTGRLFRLKMSAGLTLYDLFLRDRSRRHRWQPTNAEILGSFGPRAAELEGAFEYSDGVMNDARLVLDQVIAARQEGALCLNHARVESFSALPNGGVELGWSDGLSGTNHSFEAGALINCAGAWAPFVGRIGHAPLAERVRYSRGSHILFAKPWPHPALFLPLPGKNQYYWVWPHPEGCMVGTTERETERPDSDAMPSADEVSEIFDRLARDLPQAGLNRDTAFHAFAGLRTLPIRSKRGATPQLSRRHQWHESGGVFTLLGGKYTTARWTAREGLERVFKSAGVKREIVELTGRLLPGAAALAARSTEFRERNGNALDPALIERVLGRYGGRALGIDSAAGAPLTPLGDRNLEEEVEFALTFEQAETIDDLMCRRLELDAVPGHGLELLDRVGQILAGKREVGDLEEQKTKYREKMGRIDQLLS